MSQFQKATTNIVRGHRNYDGYMTVKSLIVMCTFRTAKNLTVLNIEMTVRILTALIHLRAF